MSAKIDHARDLAGAPPFLLGLMPSGEWETVAFQEDLFTDLTRRTLAPGERDVTMAECEQARADALAAGGIFNGCTDYYLRLRFGAGNVRHIMGYGWVVRESAAA